MRLSDAIRAGAKMGRQVRGQLFSSNGGSCAWGAAFTAVGLREQINSRPIPPNWREYYDSLDWGWVLNPEPVPWTNAIKQPPCVTITNLNDLHCWTREQIADWVEQYEPKPEPIVEVEQEQELVEA
jgi:hypothetical protein